jgi:8-oxo-dGTP pyrophosphatase MutT (NUDIX family)
MMQEIENHIKIEEEVTVSPRVILLDENGNFPLVRYKDTPWLGLPGGQVEIEEDSIEKNFLSTGAFPTLIREVKEECGIDISSYLTKKCGCLGITEVSSVSESESGKKIKHGKVLLFVCRVPGNLFNNLSEGVELVNINSHLPGPIFPDARVAIEYLKKSRGKKNGPIEPAFLGPKRKMWAQMKPKVRMLFGNPFP